MSPYVKKGGQGGRRSGSGRKTPLTDLQQLLVVERFRAEWEIECNEAEATRPPKRLRANWRELADVPIQYRPMVIQLAEKDELLDTCHRLSDALSKYLRRTGPSLMRGIERTEGLALIRATKNSSDALR